MYVRVNSQWVQMRRPVFPLMRLSVFARAFKNQRGALVKGGVFHA